MPHDSDSAAQQLRIEARSSRGASKEKLARSRLSRRGVTSWVWEFSHGRRPVSEPLRESANRVGADPVPAVEVSSKRRAITPAIAVYHAVARRAPVPQKHRVADSRCFKRFASLLGASVRRSKRRRACSAASTSSGGWEEPVRTQSINCQSTP